MTTRNGSSIIAHPGQHSTLYAEQLVTERGVVTILWLDFSREVPYVILTESQAQLEPGQKTLTVDGSPRRLRWLVPNSELVEVRAEGPSGRLTRSARLPSPGK